MAARSFPFALFLTLMLSFLAGCTETSGSSDGSSGQGSGEGGTGSGSSELRDYTLAGYSLPAGYSYTVDDCDGATPCNPPPNPGAMAQGLPEAALEGYVANLDAENGFAQSFAIRFVTRGAADAYVTELLQYLGTGEEGVCKQKEGGASGLIALRTDTIVSYNEGSRDLFESGHYEDLGDSIRAKTGARLVCVSHFSGPPASSSANSGGSDVSPPDMSFRSTAAEGAGGTLTVLSVSGTVPWSDLQVSGTAGCAAPTSGNVQVDDLITCPNDGTVRILHVPSEMPLFETTFA